MSDVYCTFKYIVIGDIGVGKTSLQKRYTDDRFSTQQPLTIGMEFTTIIVEIDGKTIKLIIHDTGGLESHKAITRSYYRENTGALLVYDITMRQTFENLTGWMDDLKEYADITMMVIMLVGNKCDLDHQRKVTTEEGLDFAERHGLLFMETSAKTAANVERAFISTANEIYSKTQSGFYLQKFGIQFGSSLPATAATTPGSGRSNSSRRIVLHDDHNVTPHSSCSCRRN